MGLYMSKFEKGKWYSVEKDGPPPFEELCLVRGKHKEFGYNQYALAYNECYRPDMNMTQVIELQDNAYRELISSHICLDIPFTIESWMLLEQ